MFIDRVEKKKHKKFLSINIFRNIVKREKKMNPQSCANSPCAGLNGCTTHTDFAAMNKCLQESCYCTEAPYATFAPATTPSPASFCSNCGYMNQCDRPDQIDDRNKCLVTNCSSVCANTFPMTPLPALPPPGR